MSKQYLAVFGGNKMACHGIARLEALGHNLIVLDGNPNAPARTPNRAFLDVDFSDIEATRAALESYVITGVVPLNDFAVRSASQIASERGLPGWSAKAAYRLTNKVAMRTAWQDAGLPQPSFCSLTLADLQRGDYPAWDAFPCIVKPAFAGGASRGVHLVRNWTETRAAVEASSGVYIDSEVVLEEYVRGTEHTLEVIVSGGSPFLLSISDKQNYPGHVSVVQNLHFPGPIGWEARDELRDLVYAACDALELTDGACHFELLLTERGPVLLEVGGRPGGGLNFDPICRLSTGYDYPNVLAQVLTGRKPRFVQGESWSLAWHYFKAGDGMVSDIRGLDEVEQSDGVIDVECYESVGMVRRRLVDDLARPGYVLVRAESYDAARRKAEQLCAQVQFITKPLTPLEATYGSL